jgi:hypothetical protein
VGYKITELPYNNMDCFCLVLRNVASREKRQEYGHGGNINKYSFLFTS